MRSELDGRLRLLLVLASVAAVVVTFLAADSTYQAASSIVPGVAIATIATALSYGHRRVSSRRRGDERVATSTPAWSPRGSPPRQLVNDGP